MGKDKHCKCGNKTYRMVNTVIEGKPKGYEPICYMCYVELLHEYEVSKNGNV